MTGKNDISQLCPPSNIPHLGSRGVTAYGFKEGRWEKWKHQTKRSIKLGEMNGLKYDPRLFFIEIVLLENK